MTREVHVKGCHDCSWCEDGTYAMIPAVCSAPDTRATVEDIETALAQKKPALGCPLLEGPILVRLRTR